MIHEDDRRTLISVPHQDGEIKIIIAKKECRLGDHYHEIKTEEFTLLAGAGTIEINDDKGILYPGVPFTILPRMRHAFTLAKDSILFCKCSHPYDANDDY